MVVLTIVALWLLWSSLIISSKSLQPSLSCQWSPCCGSSCCIAIATAVMAIIVVDDALIVVDDALIVADDALIVVGAALY